jgi:uncharacterized membrane protein YgcG
MVAVRPLLALLLGALAFIDPVAAGAKPPTPFTGGGERILSFLSDVTVTRDGALEVSELIRVRAEGNRIRRGIFRDFPTRYQRDKRTIRVGFEVAGVRRDGQPERWTTERLDNGVRVRIGDADVMLPQGVHEYAIRYRTTRQLGFFQDYDELYWNATGNGWAFPIDVAEARVRLPLPARFGNRAFYTGAQGSTANDAQVVSERPGEIVIRTTQQLLPYQGLTIAVAWPKGVVEPPAPASATAQWLQANGPLAAAILSLIGLAAFYYHAWRKAGRGPLPGTVVPLFAPPDHLSAAALRYIRRMRYDNRAFAAAIVESGVKGQVRLVETDSGLFKRDTTRIDRTGDGNDLAPPERAMLTALFGGGETSIEMHKRHHRIFSAAQNMLREKLAEAYRGRLFQTNKGWAFAGLVMVPAAMLLVGAIVAATDSYAAPGAWLIPTAGLGLMLMAIATGGYSRFARKDGSVLLAIASALLGVAGLAALIFTFPIIAESGQILPLLAPLLAMPLVVSAFWWMAAPTREGRQVMDRIAGFQRYLSITEEDRLETLHPPDKTPELFERYLPHAIALGVENRWASRFAGVLAVASTAPDQRRGMGWYSGSQNPWSNPGRFAAAMGGALASSAAAASTAPGSRSGSGGGGSSGGGGGGGGGGGW